MIIVQFKNCQVLVALKKINVSFTPYHDKTTSK